MCPCEQVNLEYCMLCTILWYCVQCDTMLNSDEKRGTRPVLFPRHHVEKRKRFLCLLLSHWSSE